MSSREGFKSLDLGVAEREAPHGTTTAALFHSLESVFEGLGVRVGELDGVAEPVDVGAESRSDGNQVGFASWVEGKGPYLHSFILT